MEGLFVPLNLARPSLSLRAALEVRPTVDPPDRELDLEFDPSIEVVVTEGPKAVVGWEINLELKVLYHTLPRIVREAPEP